jgi:hypothetical protein
MEVANSSSDVTVCPRERGWDVRDQPTIKPVTSHSGDLGVTPGSCVVGIRRGSVWEGRMDEG